MKTWLIAIQGVCILGLAAALVLAYAKVSQLQADNPAGADPAAAGANTDAGDRPPDDRLPPDLTEAGRHPLYPGRRSTLSDASRADFAERLRTMHPLKAHLEVVTSSDKAVALAKQLEASFKNAGWEVSQSVCGCYPPPQKVGLSFPRAPSDALRKAFTPLWRDLGTPERMDVDSSLPEQTVLVHVGP